MSRKRRSSYHFSLDDTLILPRKKKRRVGRYILPLVLVLLAAALVFYSGFGTLNRAASYLPFPKKLKSIYFLHNGQIAKVEADSQLTVNPKDTLQLVDVKTDGWISWGTKMLSPELDVAALRAKPVAIRELLPQETFETPKTLELRVLRWDMPIGKASILVRLDARDWLHKANTSSDASTKAEYLERALQENPGNTLAKTQLAALYLENKQFDKAAKLYEEINAAGKSVPILDKLLAVYKAQNRVDDALNVYLDRLRFSEDPEQFKDFLNYLRRHKSGSEAGKYLERHRGDIPTAFESSVLLYLADLSTQTKDWTKAASNYEELIKKGVKDPDLFYNLAVTYQKKDDLDGAVQAMEKYLQKNPNDIKSWMQLGALQERRGASAQARKAYEAVLKKEPQQKEAVIRLVSLLEKQGDKAGLRATYEKLASMEPQNKTVRNNLAVLYYEAENWEKSAESYEKLAAMNPQDVETQKHLLDLYRKLKNKGRELETLKKLADMEPDNSTHYDALFSIYNERKEYNEIVSIFQKAVKKAPNSVSMHQYLLYGLLKTGNSKDALAELEALNRLQPRNKKHLRQAANLYERSGHYTEALKKLDQLLKLDPNDEEAKDDYLRLKLLVLEKQKPA